MADGLFQFPESFGAGQQIPQNKNLPFITNEHERGFHRAGWPFFDWLHKFKPFL